MNGHPLIMNGGNLFTGIRADCFLSGTRLFDDAIIIFPGVFLVILKTCPPPH